MEATKGAMSEALGEANRSFGEGFGGLAPEIKVSDSLEFLSSQKAKISRIREMQKNIVESVLDGKGEEEEARYEEGRRSLGEVMRSLERVGVRMEGRLGGRAWGEGEGGIRLSTDVRESLGSIGGSVIRESLESKPEVEALPSEYPDPKPVMESSLLSSLGWDDWIGSMGDREGGVGVGIGDVDIAGGYESDPEITLRGEGGSTTKLHGSVGDSSISTAWTGASGTPDRGWLKEKSRGRGNNNRAQISKSMDTWGPGGFGGGGGMGEEWREGEDLRSTWGGVGGTVQDAIEKARKRREIINKGAERRREARRLEREREREKREKEKREKEKREKERLRVEREEEEEEEKRRRVQGIRDMRRKMEERLEERGVGGGGEEKEKEKEGVNMSRWLKDDDGRGEKKAKAAEVEPVGPPRRKDRINVKKARAGGETDRIAAVLGFNIRDDDSDNEGISGW